MNAQIADVRSRLQATAAELERLNMERRVTHCHDKQLEELRNVQVRQNFVI